jgi:hypothetical protein
MYDENLLTAFMSKLMLLLQLFLVNYIVPIFFTCFIFFLAGWLVSFFSRR